MTISVSKLCHRCQKSYDPSGFHIDARNPDGLSATCRICANARRRERYAANPERKRAAVKKWRQANPDKKRAWDRAYYLANAERISARSKAYNLANRDHRREVKRAWYLANASRVLASSRAWKLAHPDRIRETDRSRYHANPDRQREATKAWEAANPGRRREVVRAWTKAHPEVGRFKVARRRAWKMAAGGSHTRAEWESLCAAYGYRCLACGKHVRLTEDHIVPLSRGGSDSIDNIQPLCLPCNQRKGVRTIDYRPDAVQGVG